MTTKRKFATANGAGVIPTDTATNMSATQPPMPAVHQADALT